MRGPPTGVCLPPRDGRRRAVRATTAAARLCAAFLPCRRLLLPRRALLPGGTAAVLSGGTAAVLSGGTAAVLSGG
ncbi:hypothetical protein QM787_07875, partial [Rhodococcus ruber]|uniref:hypothetical protein n=1 Tax=Rhodococcus ruber TaxID=1830 RepID=UPI0022B59CFF